MVKAWLRVPSVHNRTLQAAQIWFILESTNVNVYLTDVQRYSRSMQILKEISWATPKSFSPVNANSDDRFELAWLEQDKWARAL